MINAILGCAIDGCDDGLNIPLYIILGSAAIIIAIIWVVLYMIIKKKGQK